MPDAPTGRAAYRVNHDPLSVLMDEVRIRTLYIGGPFALRAPWSMRHQAFDSQLYIITGGPVCLRVREGSPGETTVELENGDLVFIMGGVAHRLSDSRRTPSLESRFLEQMAPPGTPNTSGFVGMECELHGAPQTMLLGNLPELICIRARSWPPGAALAATLTAFGTERRQQGPGHAAILKRLVEIALTQVVRTWIDMPDHSTSWLRGLRDPQLREVLQAVVGRPHEKWNLQRLADIAGMSRSLFATRFRETVGKTPMAYVTQVRMHLAARILDEGNRALKAVAISAGYESQASFRRHFKRHFGVLPREFKGRTPRRPGESATSSPRSRVQSRHR